MTAGESPVARLDESTDPVLVLVGDLDLSVIADIKVGVAALLATHATELVVDLAAVTFIDSTTLGQLAVLAADGRPVILRSVSQTARRILDISGLAERLKIEDP